MVLREDFYNIAEKTLEEYYKVVFNKDIIIKVGFSSLNSRILIYPKINAIITRFPKKKVIAYTFNEFNIKTKIWKFIAVKIYVALCMYTGGLLAKKAITYSDYSLFNNNILISPANRKIRIYDFKTNTVDVIVKSSFTNKYFDNELSFRLNCKYDFIPSVIKYGEKWYRESILPGQPLARIRDKKLYNKCIKDTVIFIKRIVDDTLQYVDVKQYSQNIYDDIINKLIIAKEKKNVKKLKIIIEIAQIALQKAIKLEAPLPIVESHGDLQSGNIWVDKKIGKVYILDWETHGKRSVWYDSAIILLSIRRANMLKEMTRKCDTDKIKDALLINDPRKEYDMQAVIGIIVLEDIMFYLDDMLELPQDFGGDIFDRIIMEMDKIGWRNK